MLLAKIQIKRNLHSKSCGSSSSSSSTKKHSSKRAKKQQHNEHKQISWEWKKMNGSADCVLERRMFRTQICMWKICNKSNPFRLASSIANRQIFCAYFRFDKFSPNKLHASHTYTHQGVKQIDGYERFYLSFSYRCRHCWEKIFEIFSISIHIWYTANWILCVSNSISIDLWPNKHTRCAQFKTNRLQNAIQFDTNLGNQSVRQRAWISLTLTENIAKTHISRY